ncbi:MAG: envelope stress response membrane protein PspB [Gammaproteobacteria bacterium]|nr:envelope stress response membrane protein PspB [Gammaproteobacteria bacterium]MDH5629665.1 envelope stress response membrane protein PspB [Gammaproteobacteria bacterium]
MEEIMVAPIIVFMVIVAPIWLVLHYRSKNQKESGISEQEHQRLVELKEIANGMIERIETLEKILDQETPGWRKKHEQE